MASLVRGAAAVGDRSHHSVSLALGQILYASVLAAACLGPAALPMLAGAWRVCSLRLPVLLIAFFAFLLVPLSHLSLFPYSRV